MHQRRRRNGRLQHVRRWWQSVAVRQSNGKGCRPCSPLVNWGSHDGSSLSSPCRRRPCHRAHTNLRLRRCRSHFAAFAAGSALLFVSSFARLRVTYTIRVCAPSFLQHHVSRTSCVGCREARVAWSRWMCYEYPLLQFPTASHLKLNDDDLGRKWLRPQE